MNKKYPAGTGSKSSWDIKQLVVGALCIGLSFILSYIRIFKMPNGGSITPASMLPIMLFAYIYGMPKGTIVGVAYGLLQMIQDPWIVSLPQVLLDYVLAFGALALAGLFKKSMVPGVIVAALGRFLFAFLSGIIFFASYAPEGISPALYSLGYQASYILPEAAICMVIVLIPGIRKNIQLLRQQAIGRGKANS
ncbi:MAG: energy-coupled thiamine transporter ThiT [Christensenellaceae bacterium]|nr:energy-coupled thiamine transporter ThiT [Christensenellaceae bacterium]